MTNVLRVFSLSLGVSDKEHCSLLQYDLFLGLSEYPFLKGEPGRKILDANLLPRSESPEPAAPCLNLSLRVNFVHYIIL